MALGSNSVTVPENSSKSSLAIGPPSAVVELRLGPPPQGSAAADHTRR
jgi:hypothetical protein